MYFIVDATHQDFATMVQTARDAAMLYNGEPLNWYYNIDETVAKATVIGGTDTWYQDSAWFNHPAVIHAYNESERNEMLAALQNYTWGTVSVNPDGSGSPEGSPE